VRDEAEIRGHRRTYIGALPGRILQEMRKAGTRNPVFMLDEIDKLNNDRVHGDPAAALLEVLDAEQNFAFKDNYLGVGFDLSQIFFIGTANDVYGLPPALRDRLEIVELPGYSAFAKAHIARRHLIPKQKEKNGLANHDIGILDEALDHIIGAYTSEAGVRVLERCCGTVFRKLAVHAADGRAVPSPVDAKMVKELLGPPKLFAQKMGSEPVVGTSTGLAWSAAGGSILFVESALVPGSGGVKTTGNLGQILQESAQVAHTWIMANAERFGVDLKPLGKKTIRIHLPAGATPKDGPSAGVALAVSVVSLLSGVPVRNDVAMTGEISLRGKVMPVGGVVEKLLAAHRGGIREVILPRDNADSVAEIPKEVAGEMKIHLVDRLDEAMDIALVGRSGG
jgi:ATP-dependent Lon protease